MLHSYCISVLAVSLSLASGIIAQTVVTNVDPKYGSRAGGTRISIYGTGFGDMDTDMAVVFVGPYPCNVIMHYSSSDVLTCETAPGEASTYFVTVAVGMNEPTSFYGFTYTDDYTPTLKAVLPHGGPPGSQVFMHGDAPWRFRYYDCNPANWGDIGCIGSVMFGDYLCRVDLADPNTTMTFWPYSANDRTYYYSRYGNGYVYRFGCTLPVADSTNVQPSLGVAGNLNVSVHMEASLRGAAPLTKLMSYMYDVNGTAYQFQLHAEVSSIDPSVGSTAGGTLLKITGRGFPDTSLGLNDTITVLTNGVACSVVNSTYDTIYCVTGPKPATPPPTVTPISGLYPGMRGVEYEYYNVSTNYQYQDLWRLNRTLLLSNTNGTGSYKTTLTGAMEGVDYLTEQYCSLMKAFFRAPRAGNYTFYLQTDDIGHLNATWIKDGVQTSRMLSNLTWYVPTDVWTDNRQHSDPILLTAGQQVLLESAHCNNRDIGHAQVAVRMPVDRPQSNSIAEVQKISIRNVVQRHSTSIRYMYGAGANTSAWSIDLLTRNDSKFDDPALGLELTLNDTTPRVVLLPVWNTGPDMTLLIEISYGGNNSLGSNISTFGVSKDRGPGVVTITVGIDYNLRQRLGFEVTMARLVYIPTNQTGLVSGCSSPSGAVNSSAGVTERNVTTGVTVILRLARPVPYTNPGGMFQIRRETVAINPVQVSYTANVTEMWLAMVNLTNSYYGVDAVYLYPMRREGLFFARVWNITFPLDKLDNVATLIPEDISSSTPEGVLLTTEDRLANPPLSGSLWLAFGDSCTSISIDMSDTAETVRLKLAGLPELAAPRSVEVSGSKLYGLDYIVTFDSVLNPDDQPQLRITDASGIGGINPTASVTTVRNGSVDAFYAPISAEFLQLAVASPDSINVLVNGVPSSCKHPSGICSFSYSDTVTPHITSVSPTALDFEGATSLPLTITGTGFTAGPSIVVKVGNVTCNTTSVIATQIVCSVPDTAPAGVRLVTVNVENQGFAQGATSITLRTLYVMGASLSPIAISANGPSVFNFTGKGFDTVSCSNNKFFIGTVQCGVMACGPGYVTVVYPGNQGVAAPASSITAQVFERDLLISTDKPTSLTVDVSKSANYISAVSPAFLPGFGGTINVSLPVNPSSVTSAYLVPHTTSLTNFTALSAAVKVATPCDGVVQTSGGISCTTIGLPNGKYHVLASVSTGLKLLSLATVAFDMVITSVTPNAGSIGGGTTLTIKGSGFNSMNVSSNVVFITVPVSSVFYNGITECLAVSANDTQLTCVTSNHMDANADADDPYARKVLPVATQPQPISVSICDPSYKSTILRSWCWSLDATPQARCAPTAGASCNFEFSTELTPLIGGLNPSSGYAGISLTVYGRYLAEVAEVRFTKNGVVMGLGYNVAAGPSGVGCNAPDLLPGAYQIILVKYNGELSVDPFNDGIFTYTPIIQNLTSNAGSLAGGLPLNLTVGGAGLVTGNINDTAANVVTIAGLPCPILAVPDRWSLSCRAPGINGYVYAEYWNLGGNTFSPVDLIDYDNPVLARLERGMDFDWGNTSPAPGIINYDYFCGRFTFYYQIASAENVTFLLSSDDESRLYVDGELLGRSSNYLNIILEPGIHKMQITYVEFYGYSRLRLSVAVTPMDGNDTSSQLKFYPLEWQKVMPVPPGTVLPVELSVNDIPAILRCPSAKMQLQLTGQPELSYEPSVVSSDSCSYIYTTHRTPTLSSVKAPTYAISGITAPSFSVAVPYMHVYGNFLTTAMGQVNVTVANQTCSVTDVSTVLATSATGTPLNTTRITCIAPALPVGTWPVSVMVDSAGLARPTASAAAGLPNVTYLVVVNGASSPPLSSASSACQFSLFGGGLLNITGYGFVKGVVDPVLVRNMTAAWETTSPCGSTPMSISSPSCQAATVTSPPRLTLVPFASDGAWAVFRLTRFTVPSPDLYAGNNSITGVVIKFRPRVYTDANSTVYSQPFSTSAVNFCGGRTPLVSNISPASGSVAPDTGSASLSLTWFLSQVGSTDGIISGTAQGSPSNATVELEVGPTVLSCAGPRVSSSTIAATTYTETLSCTLPSYMPAATYTLWVCIPPFGCGLAPAYTVPLTVTAISANRGSSAGGISVTITGKGFDTNSSRVAVRFGPSVCNVTSSTSTSITCTTGPLDNVPTSPVSYSLSVTPTTGASEATYDGLVFTFDPALESSITSITPIRGSTEGGTPVSITGTGFQTGVETNVTIGETACTLVVVVSSTTITCKTGKPPGNVFRTPLPIQVAQAGRGTARSTVQYQYIDLWSRNSTWGGGPLPGFEDTVVIPKGVHVLLDMSPPKLRFLVIEGNLEFDETLPYINLQAHYILVKSGNFSIGTVEKPFPGRANITMHGAPNSLDLPMYGAKSLGVRTGVVTFHGKPKVPVYTKLNKTVDRNDTRITINGAVNWEVGDQIVIASSSYYGNEVDEAYITVIDGASVPGCTVLTLDRPMQYTHLGVIHTQAGVSQPLDMRAEVAVLTRSIVLQGDWTSAKNMYGVQVMVNTPKYLPKGLVRFDNVEITQSGQAFRLGRYSMHWHLMGDVAFQSWVRGCAIHHTYNRAITVHGTHRSIIKDTVAYHTMGHTFFLEDGIETSNLMEGNAAIHVLPSNALLNTDVTPGAFWLTNPNNTVRNNVAVGSAGYGYWYRMLDNPEGPSYTPTVCPKFTPLQEFTNNTAHSNMFYGLRIHPEFYPRNGPCNAFNGVFQQVPAVFNGLVAYKNGMKGAVVSQVGLVQFVNLVLGDNGGGPKQHIISGKENGASFEMTWLVDDRNRYDVTLSQMAGLFNATIYARTISGRHDTAGRWPSDRRVTGIITQSPVQGDSKHSALMAVVNVTFVDFVNSGDLTNFYALETCGKCKSFQGGATTFTANISFVQSDGSTPALSYWSWGQQGVFLDTDGTLLNAKNLPTELHPPADAAWAFGTNMTWHSCVDNELFDPAECVYVKDNRISNNGAYCSGALRFRRIMINRHTPQALKYKDLLVTSPTTNRTAMVHFTNYNEEGYMFNIAVNRDYWLHWDMFYRLDPETYTFHKTELMNGSDYVYFHTKYVQKKNHFKVNNVRVDSTELPPPSPTTTYGVAFYNTTMVLNDWWWSNRTYNDTKFTIFLAGRADNTLSVGAFACPDEGCNNIPDTVVDIRDGTLYWSNASTWNTAATNFKKPAYGENVTIPFGWNLVLDESPPWLLSVTIQGNLSFDPTRDINFTATYILVMGKGALRAGNATIPHPTKATIVLNGSRDTPDYALDNTLNLGSKMLTAVLGGTIELYGKTVGNTWTRLAAAGSVGNTSIKVANAKHGWQVGDKIIITSTTFNIWQSEIRTITEIQESGARLVLDKPLEQPHGALLKAYPNGPTVDMRAEVGLISSNVLITAADGESTHSYSGEFFGARVVIHGNSTGRFDRVAMTYCGQAGLGNRSCILYDRIKPLTLPVNNSSSTITAPNPSAITRSAIIYGLHSNVIIAGEPENYTGVVVAENVMYESYDIDSVSVITSGNTIRGNLVIGAIKDMVGKSTFDGMMPANFYLPNPNNFVTDNVGAGSDRYCFVYLGIPCGNNFTTGSFRNNSGHACLAGMWMMASDESFAAGCTVLTNFTTYMNWDFGIINTRGIPTDIEFRDVNILDTKHSGLTVLRKGTLTEKATIHWYGGLLAGQSSNDVCTACASHTDMGCHKRLSRQSFNRDEPFGKAVGLQSAQFAIAYKEGPEPKPWDKPKGYAIVHGMFNISGITIADFLGPDGCGAPSAGTYALSNHPLAPETFYPHYFSNINVVNVNSGPRQGMFYHIPPDKGWLGEVGCGDQTYTREDGSVMYLNCAGPAHIHWRDLDGSLIGYKGVISGQFNDQPRAFPFDQGTPLLPGPCTYSSVLDSYSCTPGSTNFLLDERLKPDPIPSDGIWGDPQYFVLESRDKDSEDRNFGPVFFNVSGSIDLVTVQFDHGCCLTYKCQKRLSTFATYLPMGQTVYVNFTGTPAQIFRLWLPYADPDKEIVLVINYLYTLNRRFVYVAPGVLPGVSGRLVPLSEPPKIGDGSGHGAYFWDRFNTLMYVKMKGGKSLEIRTENAVQVTQKFACTVDQFYDIQEIFLSNLANTMSISLDRIYIAKVVPGSAVVTTAIGPDVQQVDELTIVEGADEGDVRGDPPPGPQMAVLTDSDRARLQEMNYTQAQMDALTMAELILLRQLWGLFSKYVESVETAANAANIEVLDPPTMNIPSVGNTPEVPPPSVPGTNGQNITLDGQNSTKTTTTEAPVTANPNSGTTKDAPAVTNTPSDSREGEGGLSSGALGAIIGGVIGACVIAGVVAIAVIAVRRRRMKRTRPEFPSDALASGPSERRASSSREAFVAPATRGQPPAQPVSASASERKSGAREAAEDMEDYRLGALGSPRSPSLAAGVMPPNAASQMEVIRPLASTAMQPHVGMPLVLPTGSMAGSRVSEESVRAGQTKSPAELQRVDSMSQQFAQWTEPGNETVAPAARSGHLSQSVTDGGSRPGRGFDDRPGCGGGRPPVATAGSMGTGAAAARPAPIKAPTGDSDPDRGIDEMADVPVAGGPNTVTRALGTQESYRPRSRAAAYGSQPSNGDEDIRSPAATGEERGFSSGSSKPGSPPAQPQPAGAGRGSAPTTPTMMLPGGMAEFLASPSLLRSEVAATIVAAAASSGAGFGGAAEVVMQEEEQSSAAVARSPAGLSSDSFRNRERGAPYK